LTAGSQKSESTAHFVSRSRLAEFCLLPVNYGFWLEEPLLVELPLPVESPLEAPVAPLLLLEPCKLLSLDEPLPRCWFKSLEPG
jgi:hypothetical protein